MEKIKADASRKKLLGNSIQLCGDLPKILIQIQCACTDLIAA